MARKAGWLRIAALGVAIVVAGNYVAWNFGIAEGGWLGMLIAVVLAGLLYLALATCVAELASMFRSAAAAVEFVRQGFGTPAGAAAGWCVMSEFVGAGAALAVFFGAYGHGTLDLAPSTLILALIAGALALQLLGAHEVLWVTQCMTIAAIGGVLITTAFVLAAIVTGPHHMPPIGEVDAEGVGLAAGVWAAIPYAVALFLGVEGIAIAAEEAEQPERTIPRALLSAVGAQGALVLLLLLLIPAAVDVAQLSRVDDPIAFAWRSIGEQGARGVLAKVCTGCALLATATSFFSVMFAYSRQLHALAREGFLPRVFALSNRRSAPVMALLAPSAVALLLALACPAELLVVLCVFGATASYVLIFGAHLRLRRIAPGRRRAYRAPGEWVAIVGMALTGIAFLACMRNHGWAASMSAVAILLLTLYSVRHMRGSA